MKKFHLDAQEVSPDANSAIHVMSPKSTLRNIPNKVETMIHTFFFSTPIKTNTNTIIEQIVHNQFQTFKPLKNGVLCFV